MMVKTKTFWVMIPALFLVLSLYGQRFKAGVVAGVNLSQIDGDDLAGFNSIGINAGGSVAAILSDRWQLSMEMLFSQHGSKRTLNDPVSAALEKVRLNVVEVPVLINFLEWKFRLHGGVTYARLIDYTFEDILGQDVSDRQDLNSGLFLVNLGGTFFFDDHWGIQVRWLKSLNDLQAREGANQLISRQVSIRGVYIF